MRFSKFDSFEFENSSSEELVLFAQSQNKNFDDLYCFYLETLKLDGLFFNSIGSLPEPVPIGKVNRSGVIVQYLKELCNLTLVGTESFYEVQVDELLVDYLFKYKHFFIRFQWQSTA